MATKLYVGNLSYQTTDQDLAKMFGEVGTVASAQVVTDRYTNESRGFGFVSFRDEASAADARNKMNGQMLDGRNLKVDVAADKPRGGGGGCHPSPLRPAPPCPPSAPALDARRR